MNVIPSMEYALMQEEAIVRSVVETVFPEDYAVIGKMNREQLFSTAEPEFVTVDEGHPFSVKEPLEIIAAAIVVVRELLLAADQWKASHSRLPSSQELSGSVAQSALRRSAEVASHLSEMVEAVLKLLSRRE